MEILMKERTSAIEEIDELNLYNDSASNQLTAKTKEKEELMVEANILRLELKKLRGFLNTRADEHDKYYAKVFSLESRQIQLQLALEERTKEIEINKEMLRFQIKGAEDERHSANAELRDRIGKVEKLKRRYEILTTQFAPPDDDTEDDHSQAFYVIRAAQQREELQREGDELDKKIRKAEKEIKALENTLNMMNDRNEEYRMQYVDVLDKNVLLTQYQMMMEQYKSKREQIQNLQQDLLHGERSLAALTSEESHRLQTVQLLESKMTSLRREISEQEAKRDRAYKLARKQSKDVLAKTSLLATDTRVIGPGMLSHIDSSLSEVLDIMVRYIKDLATILIGDLNKFGIQLPSRAVSRISSRDNFKDDISEGPGTPMSRSSVHSRASSNGRTAAQKGLHPLRSATASRLDLN
ncbi:Coiled-coil domain-containing protein 39, partial [Nowakowskiella sp. JEL0078]